MGLMVMDEIGKYKIGDVFLCGKTYTTEWKIVHCKKIAGTIHYELEAINTTPRPNIILSEWALTKDSNWNFS
tara:strand:+ start:212 stop:427 length:216 start_codon:yes stop_codon:yes gene_type:complete